LPRQARDKRRETLTKDPVPFRQELRHYQRSILPTQRLVILFHRQYFTATSHVTHWRALIAALKAQESDGTTSGGGGGGGGDYIVPRFDFSALPRPIAEMAPMLADIRAVRENTFIGPCSYCNSSVHFPRQALDKDNGILNREEKRRRRYSI
jgi:hypothetical protein